MTADRPQSPRMKAAALRQRFAAPAPIVIAGAHDGLSARLVAEAGFDGVWASGFEISAAHGVPDASLLTMTETLVASRVMAEAVDIPVIADGDTGFGNAINAIRAVRAFEAAGVAGLCIEDNVFPKRCSFYPGVKRLLADTDEQALKIRAAVDDRIVPLGEVYRLVNLGQLKTDERAYLPPDAESMKAVILAAGFDDRLMPLVSDRPKAMLDVKGKSILERQIEALHQCGVRQIAVVRGYKKEQVALPGIRYYDNDAFEESGELESLLRAGAELSGTVIVMYGDILFDRSILERLLQSAEDITLVCDRSWPDTRVGREAAGCDLVVESPTPRRHHRFLADAQPVMVNTIGATIDPAVATAEFIGMAKLSARGCQILGEVYRELRELGDDRP